MASIIVRERDEEPHVVHLDRMRMTIGRSVRSDIPLRDPFASRLHAVLQHDGPYVILADIGSSNRTLVNGVAVNEPRRLVAGDVINIGEAELTFLAHDKTSIPPPVTFVGGEHDSLPDGDATLMRDAGALLATLHLRAVPEVSPESTGEIEAPRTDLLEIMSRVGVVLIQKSTVTEVLRGTLELVFEALPAERGFVFLRQGGDIVCKLAATPTALLPRDPPPRLSRTILSRAVHDGTMVRTADAGIDPRFRRAGSVEMGAIRSVLAVPLLAGNEILGALYVDADIRNRFADSDLSVLATIAAVAAIKIEHERLLAEVQEKRRIQEELKIAGEIQARLLPMTPPKVEGWDLTGVSLPCLEVGGDYFDFINLPQRRDDRRQRIGIAVGDVSGKGTGAALLISSVHAGLRAEANVGESVADVMRKLNRYLAEYAPSNKFVTLFYGALDPETGRLIYANAGHEPPIVIRKDGTVERLTAGGIAIGIKDDETYEEGEAVLLPGDVFVCYSDGISESVNARGEQFGEARIIEVAQAARGMPAPRVRDRIEEALSFFVGATAPIDDMTLVVATRR
ncbi:MAG: SpoIIE family protein phosphatase [Polyangiales bacterium]